MALSIYCSKCDKQVEITRNTVHIYCDLVYIRCDYCDDKEVV